MNYNFIFYRIIMIFAAYFGIYTNAYVGEFGFLPLYLMLFVYALATLFITVTAVASPKVLSAELAKRTIPFWYATNLFDVGCYLILMQIFSFNYFTFMASVMGWFALVAIFNFAVNICLRIMRPA